MGCVGGFFSPPGDTSVIEADITALENAVSDIQNDVVISRKKNYSNLRAVVNPVIPESQIDVSFDSMIVDDIELTSKTYTLDISSGGALGLDSGSEANDTWYYYYVLTNDDGSSDTMVFSANSSNPTLPLGYTKYQLIGAVKNDASGDFISFSQTGNEIDYTSSFGQKILDIATTGASSHEVDCSSLIPDKVTKVRTFSQFYGLSSSGGLSLKHAVYNTINGNYTNGGVYRITQALGISADTALRALITTDSKIIKIQFVIDGGVITSGLVKRLYIVGFRMELF